MFRPLFGLYGYEVLFAFFLCGLLQQVDISRPWQVMLWDFVYVLALSLSGFLRLKGTGLVK